MKIVFNRQEISNKIAPLMSVVSGKSTLTAVEGILIEANSPDCCTLTAFDLEKGIKITVDADVIEQGSYIINAQKFNQTLRVMNGDEITLTVDNKLGVVFECGKSSHRTGALKAEDFPEIPDLQSEKGFIVNQAQFKKMLSKVSYAMGVNEPRPVLNGCYIKTEEGKMNVVACDGFKLAVCSAESELKKLENSDRGVEFSFIVPVKSVNEIVKLLSDDEEDTVTVYMSHKNMVIAFEGLTFFTRLIVGEFVDYNRIIIKNHKIEVKASKQDILAALEKASLITEERIAGSVRSHVRIEVCGDILKVSAVSSAGSIYDELNIEHEGDDISIAFNNRFLIDSVRACRSETIKLSMSSPLMGINVEPCDEESGSELFMLLPVRTRD
ncbi:MAG: DNA polymerase III subunit beta [Clostridia bacterium]|nr:DNA polymerase III subunit beta [Clostridia bacterium]MBR4032533.1 DNA polymerase III subunit beta [Clostridia bacterium]